MKTITSTIFTLAAVAVGFSAEAQTILSSYFTGEETFAIDGQIDEWVGKSEEESATFFKLGKADLVSGDQWEGDEDSSAELALAHNERDLFFACTVSDQRLIRSRGLSTGEDHLELWFGIAGSKGRSGLLFGVGIWADPQKGTVEIRKLGLGASKARGKVKGAKGAVYGEQTYYTVEVSIPWSSFPGGKRSRSGLRAAVYLLDGDTAAKMTTKSVLGTASVIKRGSADDLPILEQADLMQALKKFFKEVGLSSTTVPRDNLSGDLAGDSVPEQLVIVDRYLMAYGSGIGGTGAYIYHVLPVSRVNQIVKTEVRDLTGDGKLEIILELVEDKGTTTRRWVSVFQVTPAPAFGQIFSAAILVSNDFTRVENSYRIVPDKGRARAFEFKPGRVQGLSKGASADEIPSQGENRMVVPWDKPARVRYVFREGRFVRK